MVQLALHKNNTNIKGVRIASPFILIIYDFDRCVLNDRIALERSEFYIRTMPGNSDKVNIPLVL